MAFQTFPKPWSVAAFITMVVRVLRIADFKLKIDVLEAIHMLHLQEGITTPEPIYKVKCCIFLVPLDLLKLLFIYVIKRQDSEKVSMYYCIAFSFQ